MKVIIFGIGDFSKQLKYYLENSSKYKVEYFCVSQEYFKEEYFLGKQVLIFEDINEKISNEEYKFVLGVGYRSLRLRKLIFNQIKEKGYDFINYVHPTAKIYGDITGEGNIILPNVIIEPFSIIENNNIIWTNSLICHDSIVGNHNFIAAGTVVGGHSKILENNFLGFNVTIKENIIINQEVLIGAKSLVLSSPDDHSLYLGIPAKKIRSHKENGIEII